MTTGAVDGAPKHSATSASQWLAVLGVVYGDIGTSPLYALKSSMQVFEGVAISEVEILGILSLFFWSLVLIVTVKYVTLVMRADNHGEGGILALMALAQRVAVNTAMRNALALIGIVGAGLFFGDGIITPAISVLSAVEGLEVAAPTLREYVLPISVVVIIALFAMQYRGTHSVGRVFGPVMALWFMVLAVLGIVQIAYRPDVLLAVSPWYAFRLCLVYKYLAFVVLGAVVLCVTGAEALYADMGHFGRRPIRHSWTFIVLPSLVLCYFGQGALVLRNPAAVENPFFLMAPEWSRLALVILATAATVIASQAVISGAYSATRQCMQLGFLPRLTVRHTSNVEEGQIYVPRVNAALMTGVLALVVLFKTSDNLASAYGIAVTGTFLCTAVLAMVVFRRQFGWSRSLAVVVFGTLFMIDGVFFAANTLKIVEGGWVPLVLGISLIALMTSWKRGRDLLLARWRQDSMPIAPFLARLPQSRSIIRVPGLAVDASWVSQAAGMLRGMDNANGLDAQEHHSPDWRQPADPFGSKRVDFDRLMLELAGRQHYVVARDQLREFGTERQIEHRLAKGRLERVHEGVYRVVGSPDTWHQRLRAACLASSGANAVSFRAAAQMWSLPGGAEIVEVTAPRHRRMQFEDVTIHESFFLTDLDVTHLHGIPVTRPARVLCDLALLVARGELRPSTLDLALQDALRRDLVDVPRVWREWERIGGVMRPGGHVVEALLNQFIPPVRKTDSTPELQLLLLLRAAGLPEPVPQQRVQLHGNRSCRLDFAWPEMKLYCEFDPYKWHGGSGKYMLDSARRLELATLGWYGVPVTDDELDSGAQLATRLLRQHVARAG